jgi:hypothetical protein
MKLAEWLKKNKEDIVKKVEVLTPGWSDTYGSSNDKIEYIEVIDFDALMTQIEVFEESFKNA